MTTLALSIEASGDDVYLFDASTLQTTRATHAIGNAVGTAKKAAYRLAIAIPAGAIVTSATFINVASSSLSSKTVYTNLALEQVDNAGQISTVADFNARLGNIGDVVAWDSIPSWVAGTSYASPDLSSIFQAIIDRPGWASGNAVQLFWVDDGSSFNAYRNAAAWDDTTYDPPLLTIEYTEGSGGGITHSVIGSGIVNSRAIVRGAA